MGKQPSGTSRLSSPLQPLPRTLWGTRLASPMLSLQACFRGLPRELALRGLESQNRASWEQWQQLWFPICEQAVV
jgi:hypothetical protein